MPAVDALLVTAEPCLIATMTEVQCEQAISVVMQHMLQQQLQHPGKDLEHIQHGHVAVAQQQDTAAAGAAVAAAPSAAEAGDTTSTAAADRKDAANSTASAGDSDAVASINASADNTAAAVRVAAAHNTIDSIASADSGSATNAAVQQHIAGTAGTVYHPAVGEPSSAEQQQALQEQPSVEQQLEYVRCSDSLGMLQAWQDELSSMHATLQLNTVAFLARFVDDAEELCQREYSQMQPQQQRDDLSSEQRNLTVAFDNLGITAPTPLHDESASSKKVPKLQVHSVRSQRSKHTGAAGLGLEAATGEAPAPKTGDERLQRAPTAAAAAAGADLPSAREAWLRSELYDPFGLLQPQLKASAMKEQLIPSDRLAGNQAMPGAVTTRSAYYSLSAATDQLQSGSITKAGQMQRQDKAARQQQQQPQIALSKTSAGDNSSNNRVKGLGTVTATHGAGKQLQLEAMQQQKHHASDILQLLRGASTDEDNDESDGLIATSGKAYKHSSCSWKIEHQRWNVPAYNSETGYVGGMYDENTATMYID